jgi:hypothetical protein
VDAVVVGWFLVQMLINSSLLPWKEPSPFQVAIFLIKLRNILLDLPVVLFSCTAKNHNQKLGAAFFN